MSAKIIDESRYKKTTRREVEKKKKKINKKKYSTTKKKENDLKYKKEKLNRIKEDKKIREQLKKKNDGISNIKQIPKKKFKEEKKKIYIPKTFKIAIIVIVIIGIGFLSRKIVNFENMPILNVFSNNDKGVKLEKDYDLKMAISKLDTTDTLKTKNVILNELNLLADSRLLKITEDYKVEYVLASKVEKVSNKDYLLYYDGNVKKGYEYIKSAIDKINENKETNPYYNNIKNIKEINVENDYIKISLNDDDPYFIYRLDFPLYWEDKDSLYIVNSSDDSKINYLRQKSDLTLKNISLTNYSDTDDMVADFRNDKLDVFFTSSENVMQMIGRHDYNVKKYRDGENIFLLGNKESEIFKQKEVRKALVYSLNREDIIKEVNNKFYELIDLPFIYSNIKYKYDVYGAENELLSNSWKKVDGIYAKELDGVNRNLELNLLLNEEDEIKKSIAQKIKSMAKNVGIKIHLDIVNNEDFEIKLQNKEYDIILADVYVNQYPDIEFLKDYVNVDDKVKASFEKIYSSSTKEELEENISSLQDVMSEEIACIGICARNSNVVYQKYISGFKKLGYMNVFDEFTDIGRIEESKN